MPIRFACPQCSQKLSVSSRKAGTSATCPRCQKQITVPSPPQAEPSVADAALAAAQIAGSPVPLQAHFEDEDPHAPFKQFVVYDDTELVYDTEEPVEQVDANVDYDSIAVPRYVLYVQGALLGIVGLVCFTLGLLAGGSLFTRAEPSAPHPVTLSGSVSYARGARDLPDMGAVVIAVPQTEQLDERAPVAGLRPDEPPPPPGHRGVEILRTIGGAYARTDEQGRFRLELPSTGKYFVLVLSANARRPANQAPATEDLLKMGRYFDNAADLLGRNRYQWTAETLRSDRQLNVVFD
jgi:hypothetical protein